MDDMNEDGALPLRDRAAGLRPQPASAFSQSSIPSATCRNCAGAEWVCENHPDRPWEPLSTCGGACACGAGMPCRACNSAYAPPSAFDVKQEGGGFRISWGDDPLDFIWQTRAQIIDLQAKIAAAQDEERG